MVFETKPLGEEAKSTSKYIPKLDEGTNHAQNTNQAQNNNQKTVMFTLFWNAAANT